MKKINVNNNIRLEFKKAEIFAIEIKQYALFKREETRHLTCKILKSNFLVLRQPF